MIAPAARNNVHILASAMRTSSLMLHHFSNGQEEEWVFLNKGDLDDGDDDNDMITEYKTRHVKGLCPVPTCEAPPMEGDALGHC